MDSRTEAPSVPTIILDTATADTICLLAQGALSGTSSCSLPNLDDESIRTAHRDSHKDKSGKSGGGTNSTLSKPSQLSVYCSPRVSRRHLGKTSGSGRGRGRSGSQSSDSDSAEDVQSASHLSTCATSDYTRFTSCDRLTTAGTTDVMTPEQPATGKLRRICSNPEGCFTETDRNLRDSKSCSDLERPGQCPGLCIRGGPLLSPPSPHPCLHGDPQEAALSMEQVYDQIYKGRDAKDKKACREVRIRQWLQEVTISVPKDERNHVTDSWGWRPTPAKPLGAVSIAHKTSYHKILWSVFRVVRSLWKCDRRLNSIAAEAPVNIQS